MNPLDPTHARLRFIIGTLPIGSNDLSQMKRHFSFQHFTTTNKAIPEDTVYLDRPRYHSAIDGTSYLLFGSTKERITDELADYLQNSKDVSDAHLRKSLHFRKKVVTGPPSNW